MLRDATNLRAGVQHTMKQCCNMQHLFPALLAEKMFTPSLRNKILLVYAFSKVVMLVFVAVVLADLHYLQTRIQGGEGVAALREAIQEARREEKNLFLYADPSSYDQLMVHLADASKALVQGEHVLSHITDRKTIRRAASLLVDYRRQLDTYLYAPPVRQTSMQDDIRASGRALSDLTEQFSQRERAVLSEAVTFTRSILLAAITVVVLLGALGAWFLIRQVVRPMRDLEAQLALLPGGHIRKLNPTSKDSEIQSFSQAFNAMLKKLEAQQHQLRHHEKAAALGVLVYGVAHELNNPLSNISTSAQLLLEGEGDVEMRQTWLAQIDSESERARRIVRRLLDSVRQPRLHKQTYRVADLIQSSLALVERQLPPQVKVCVDAENELTLEADRERLHQVLINLVKNATDAGATRVEIHAAFSDYQSVEESGHRHGETAVLADAARILQLRIEDNGPGIPEAYLDRIFDPFFTTRQTGDGTGLGLYLVEEIVSEHDGAISVQPRPGGGTVFSLWLPVKEQIA